MNVGLAWLKSSADKRGAIYRALRIDPNEPGAAYAVLPFTILTNEEGTWIAGAVGIWRAFDPADWSVDDISDVILWNPRTNIVRLLGDDYPTLILPHSVDARIPVYADGFAFFRAWADNRAATIASIRTAIGLHRITQAEPADSGVPGALVIGDINRVNWIGTGASVLVAQPCVDARKLNSAVIRSAHLPRVESLAA